MDFELVIKGQLFKPNIRLGANPCLCAFISVLFAASSLVILGRDVSCCEPVEGCEFNDQYYDLGSNLPEYADGRFQALSLVREDVAAEKLLDGYEAMTRGAVAPFRDLFEYVCRIFPTYQVILRLDLFNPGGQFASAYWIVLYGKAPYFVRSSSNTSGIYYDEIQRFYPAVESLSTSQVMDFIVDLRKHVDIENADALVGVDSIGYGLGFFECDFSPFDSTISRSKPKVVYLYGLSMPELRFVDTMRTPDLRAFATCFDSLFAKADYEIDLANHNSKIILTPVPLEDVIIPRKPRSVFEFRK